MCGRRDCRGGFCLDAQSLIGEGDLVWRNADEGQQILPGELLAGLNALGIAALLPFLINGERETREDHQSFVHFLLLAIVDAVQSVVFD